MAFLSWACVWTCYTCFCVSTGNIIVCSRLVHLHIRVLHLHTGKRVSHGHAALLNNLPVLQLRPSGCFFVVLKAQRCRKHAAYIAVVNLMAFSWRPFRSALLSGKWENKRNDRKSETKWSMNVFWLDILWRLAASCICVLLCDGLRGSSMLMRRYDSLFLFIF